MQWFYNLFKPARTQAPSKLRTVRRARSPKTPEIHTARLNVPLFLVEEGAASLAALRLRQATLTQDLAKVTEAIVLLETLNGLSTRLLEIK